MLFVISGLDKPDHLEARLATRPAHLAYWRDKGAAALLGGPYLDEAGNPVGSMLVVEAADQAEAQAMADADPYVTQGVFGSVSVRPWSWVLNAPEGL